MPTSVLGVDLAVRRWTDNGSAILRFDENGWLGVEPAVVRWPDAGTPTASALAEIVDAYARDRGVAAVALDGPQGWRDPAAPAGRGAGRACEREAVTQGKTGVRGVTYPATQRRWFELAIDVFALLLTRPGVTLVNDPAATRLPALGDGYYLLESFPTSTWRSSGLRPLPGKRTREDIGAFARALADAYALPRFAVRSHDDLQAIVAALPASALLGASARPIARGEPARIVDGYAIEGLIWDAAPAVMREPVRQPPPAAVPLLVVVSGPPAAGKSTLARGLADELSLPLLAKDDIKETLYDTLGIGDRAWSRRLGHATFELQLRLGAELLRAGRGFVLEGNFDPEFDPLSRLPPHRAVQVYCTAPRDVLLERFETRERHPGHVDDEVLRELRAGEHDHRTFRLNVAATVDVDTVSAVDVRAVGDAIRRLA